MIAIAVDDEPIVLKALKSAISASGDIAAVYDFDSCSAALEWVKHNPTDIAFLDIHMRGMGGLELAKGILAENPGCRIVFCTGYSEYAVDAFQLHVSGYLMKPVTAEAIQKEIDHIKGVDSRKKLLKVQCFGVFEVYADGEPLSFRRSKAKELLAFLVDRKGAGVTAKQICASLWDSSSDDSKNMDYLRQLFSDLRNTLSHVGAEDILLRNGYEYCVDIQRIDCDYFRYCATGTPPFLGEYMQQYSWAEATAALLWKNK